MKKILAILTIVLCFAVTAAIAGGQGKELYQSKCAKCHRDGTESSKAGGGVVLKGQSKEDIKMKLNGYLDSTYGGKKKKTMTRVLKKFNQEQINAMSRYIGRM